ncbi:MAG TPA: hypothetical protein VHX61_04990 [Rhizomicrobium sp.]|jgi:hypothetical protein|nr:hypothetical protein [Rhizomicrobium sp.]
MRHSRILLLPALVIIALGSPGETATAQQCVTSKANGSCPVSAYYYYPQITESNGYNTYVNQDVWNPIHGWKQTLYSTDPGNWYVIANMPVGNTAVVSYPDTQQIYGSRLSHMHFIYSSFSESSDTSTNTIDDTGYDIWLNQYADEVMIQHEVAGHGQCDGSPPVAGPVKFGGTHHVPAKSWLLCQYGSELIWQLPSPKGAWAFGISHGRVDVLSMLTWLVNHKYLQANATLDQIDYGFELSSTNGTDETFAVTALTIKSK